MDASYNHKDIFLIVLSKRKGWRFWVHPLLHRRNRDKELHRVESGPQPDVFCLSNSSWRREIQKMSVSAIVC